MKKFFIFICLLFSYFSGVFAAGDITDEGFTIEVGDFTPGGSLIGNDADETINNVLLSAMQKLVIFSGSLAVLFMIIGGGFMVFSHGDDNLVSRGKSMFTGGIIAMVVILSSGVVVKLFTYLLY